MGGFETRLSVTFATLDKEEGRAVYSYVSKLRLLNRKIKADFLETVRTNIELELARTPMTMTYNTALATYRNAVNRKPPENDSVPKRTRKINEANRGRNNGGRGGRGRGRGRGKINDSHNWMHGLFNAQMAIDWKCIHPIRSVMNSGQRYHKKQGIGWYN